MAGVNINAELADIFGGMGFGHLDYNEEMQALQDEVTLTNEKNTGNNNMTQLVPPPPRPSTLRRSARIAKEMELQAERDAAAAALAAKAEAERKFAKNAKAERLARMKFLAARVAQLHGSQTPAEMRSFVASNPLLEADTKTAILKLAQLKENTLAKKQKLRDEFYDILMKNAQRAASVGESAAAEILMKKANSLKGGKRTKRAKRSKRVTRKNRK